MPDEREVRNPQFIERWRSHLSVLLAWSNSVSPAPKVAPGKDIDIFFSGSDAQTFKAAAVELAEELKVYNGVTDIVDDLPYGKQQFIFSDSCRAISG